MSLCLQEKAISSFGTSMRMCTRCGEKRERERDLVQEVADFLEFEAEGLSIVIFRMVSLLIFAADHFEMQLLECEKKELSSVHLRMVSLPILAADSFVRQLLLQVHQRTNCRSNDAGARSGSGHLGLD